MKKIMIVVSLFVVLMIVEANLTTYRVYVPQLDVVERIEIEANNQTYDMDLEKHLEPFVEVLKEVKPVYSFWINEEPKLDDANDIYWFTMHMKAHGSMRSLIYQKNANYYIDQPYNGIYKINESQFQRLVECFQK